MSPDLFMENRGKGEYHFTKLYTLDEINLKSKRKN